MYTQAKKDFRARCKKILQHHTPLHRRYSIDKKAIHILKTGIKLSKGDRVLAFIPLDLEVNILPFLHRLRQKGVKVYVPVTLKESFIAAPFRLPLRKKKFGILEPPSSRLRLGKIDVALVPIIGVDATMRRIGFGKGMYDRFFEAHRFQIRHTVCMARIACIHRKRITESFDVQCHYIITGYGAL